MITPVVSIVAIGVVGILMLSSAGTPAESDGHAHDGSEGAHTHGEVIAGGSDSKYPIVTVQQPVDATESQHTIEAAGQVLASQHADIYPRREGVVQSLSVDLGDTVAKGRVVASLQPDKDQTELAAELAFKQRQLEIARQRQTINDNTETNVAQSAVDSAQKERGAQIKKVDAEIESAVIKKQQGVQNIENSAFDLLDTGTELLYEHVDTLSDLARDVQHARRHEVFYGNQKVSEATEAQLFTLHRMIMGKEKMLRTKELITFLNDLSKNIRLLPSSASTNGTTFTPEQLDHLREKINEVTDEFYEKSQEYAGVDSELLALEAEKEALLASTQQRVVDLQSTQKGTDLDIQTIEAEIERIRIQMGAARTVYAPFSGVITKRHVGVGDSVDLDKPLFTLVDSENMFVRFNVIETDLPFIQKGTIITFAPTSAPSHVHRAIIARIAQSIDPDTRTILVEADLDPEDKDGHALSQMTVRAYIPTSHSENLVAIPEKALEVSGSSNQVWIVNQDIEAELREIKVQYIHKGSAFIEEGLTGEEWIIIKSPVEVKEGLEIDTTTSS